MLASLVLASMVVLAPLPFGGVLPRDRAALQVGAFIALALAVTVRRSTEPLRHVRAPLAALGLLALVGFLQLVPWPAAIVELLSPTAARLWAEAAQIRGAPEPSWIGFSLAPDVTRSTLLHLLAVGACLSAAALQAGERPARRLLGLSLVTSMVVQIFYGAERWLSNHPEIWGLEVPGDPSRLRGTFVNPDHFAFFLGLAVPCAAAWLWWGARKAFDTKTEAERRLMSIVLPLAVFSFCFASVAFTGSRAGLVAVVGGLGVQGLILALRYQRWQLAGVGVGLLGLGLGAIWALGWNRGLGRLLETSVYEITWNARFQVWFESLELIARSPLLGTGLGTFRQAFPLVQPTHLPGSWRHAHSDVLELVITAGLLALPLLGWAAWGIGRRLWHLLHKGRRSEDRVLALGALGVCAGSLLHSLVDFSLTMPANAFLLAILVGTACGTPELIRRKRVPQTVFLDAEASAEPLPADDGETL